MTPLHLASDAEVKQFLALESGDFQTALQLLPKGSPPITIGPDRFTPLHYACRHGEVEVTSLLITQYKYSVKSLSKHGQTPVHLAAQYGHTDNLEVLVECSKISQAETEGTTTEPRHSSSAIDTHRDEHGNTPLHSAASHGQPIALKYLVNEFHSNPACTNENGETPLHLAAQNGHLDVAKCLVDEESCPTSPTDEQGRTPLYLAAGTGQLEVVRYLIEEKKCDPHTGTTKRWKTSEFNLAPGRTPLHTASRKGHLNVVYDLVGSPKCDPLCSDDDGVTPLHLASDNEVKQFLALESGDFQTALQLLPKDGPPITIGPDGFTPLHYACRHGETELIRLLITQYKYSVKSLSKHGQTPVHLAAQYGHTDNLEVLVECSEVSQPETEGTTNKPPHSSPGSVTHQDEHSNTPLHTAASHGQLTDVKYLVKEVHCNPTCTNQNGETPLHLAAQNGHLDVVKYLVDEEGCPTSPADEQGRTPLYLAAGRGQLVMVRYLIEEKKCDPHAGTTKRWTTSEFNLAPGRTLLHTASRKGHLNVVYYLVGNLKFDPLCRDDDGVTPLHLASDDEVKQFLAVESGDFQTALQLLPTDGPPVTIGPDGFTPLHYACCHGDAEVTRLLIIQYKYSIKSLSKHGQTPVHLAAQYGHTDTLRVLMEHSNNSHPETEEATNEPPHSSSAIVTLRDDHGNTPLHNAAAHGQLRALKYLVN